MSRNRQIIRSSTDAVEAKIFKSQAPITLDPTFLIITAPLHLFVRPSQSDSIQVFQNPLLKFATRPLCYRFVVSEPKITWPSHNLWWHHHFVKLLQSPRRHYSSVFTGWVVPPLNSKLIFLCKAPLWNPLFFGATMTASNVAAGCATVVTWLPVAAACPFSRPACVGVGSTSIGSSLSILWNTWSHKVNNNTVAHFIAFTGAWSHVWPSLAISRGSVGGVFYFQNRVQAGKLIFKASNWTTWWINHSSIDLLYWLIAHSVIYGTFALVAPVNLCEFCLESFITQYVVFGSQTVRASCSSGLNKKRNPDVRSSLSHCWTIPLLKSFVFFSNMWAFLTQLQTKQNKLARHDTSRGTSKLAGAWTSLKWINELIAAGVRGTGVFCSVCLPPPPVIRLEKSLF